MTKLLRFAAVCIIYQVAVGVAAAAEPLASWNEGPAKSAILKFVDAATRADSPQFVPLEERIATFDNDGTLWVEQPIYTQVQFAFDRIKTLAPKHPEWKSTEPFRTMLDEHAKQAPDFTLQDFEKVIAATHAGLTVEEFSKVVADWLATAKHPRFKRPYTELVYQPMLEALAYLRANGFKTYIVTGGGQDFVRVFAEKSYGIPPEQVIGSAGKTKYEYAKDGQPQLLKLPELLLIDDKAGKAEGIHTFIGRHPRAAFGNSTGDQQMLEWTQAGGDLRLMMLVHHDDEVREYAYGADSKIGTFSAALMKEATDRKWSVISMKRDWKRIFAWEGK